MTTNTINEIVQKHDKAEVILSCFFGAVDVIFYFILQCLFGCEFNKKCCSPRQKLSLLIIIDILFRIINIYITSFIFSLTMEIIKTAFATFEFLLILMILNQMFSDNKPNLLENGEIFSPLLTSLGFILFVININFSKMLLLVQYISGILASIIYGYYLKGKIELYLGNVEKKTQNYAGQICINNLSLFIPLYFTIYLALKIIALIVQNQLYVSYLEMGSDIFKEVGKYFSFALVIFLYNLYNKYLEENFDYSSNSGEVGISSLSSSTYN